SDTNPIRDEKYIASLTAGPRWWMVPLFPKEPSTPSLDIVNFFHQGTLLTRPHQRNPTSYYIASIYPSVYLRYYIFLHQSTHDPTSPSRGLDPRLSTSPPSTRPADIHPHAARNPADLTSSQLCRLIPHRPLSST